MALLSSDCRLCIITGVSNTCMWHCLLGLWGRVHITGLDWVGHLGGHPTTETQVGASFQHAVIHPGPNAIAHPFFCVLTNEIFLPVFFDWNYFLWKEYFIHGPFFELVNLSVNWIEILSSWNWHFENKYFQSKKTGQQVSFVREYVPHTKVHGT